MPAHTTHDIVDSINELHIATQLSEIAWQHMRIPALNAAAAGPVLYTRSLENIKHALEAAYALGAKSK